jgi:hypothetical protein
MNPNILLETWIAQQKAKLQEFYEIEMQLVNRGHADKRLDGEWERRFQAFSLARS